MTPDCSALLSTALQKAIAAACLATLIALAFPAPPALAQTSGDAAPRTITDIAAILAQEKEDPVRAAAQQAKANAAPPEIGDQRAVARFYIDRAEMRGRLGRVHEAIADLDQAINLAQGSDLL